MFHQAIPPQQRRQPCDCGSSPDEHLRGEPHLLDLIDDPIAEMLRRGDGIDRSMVLATVEAALQRLTPQTHP